MSVQETPKQRLQRIVKGSPIGTSQAVILARFAREVQAAYPADTSAK